MYGNSVGNIPTDIRLQSVNLLDVYHLDLIKDYFYVEMEMSELMQGCR